MTTHAAGGASLDGVEILEVGTQTPGQYASLLLSDLGARVIRVDRASLARTQERVRPVAEADLLLNRGKRSIALDLQQAAARDVMLRLAARADVWIESFRPGVAARLGIGPEDVCRHNPRLIYGSLSGFGQTGPDAARPAYDLTLLGRSGVLRALFPEGVAPRPPGVYLADAVSGLVAALAITGALLGRERSGRGGQLDLSMLDSVFSLLSVSHGVRSTSGDAAAVAFASPLYEVYETADGSCVTLAAIRPASCRALFEELGRPELAERTLSGDEATVEVSDFLRQVFRSAPAAHWIERLAPLDVEIGPVPTPEQAFDDATLAHRGMVVEARHPDAGPHLEVGSALGADRSAARPAPRSGADSQALLRELGYDAAAIAQLLEAGAVQGEPSGDS
jgi:alpha-methylacyl-CoA racemase